MGFWRAAGGALVVAAALGIPACGGGGNDMATGTAGASGLAGVGGSGIGGAAGTGGVRQDLTACGAARPCGGEPIVGTWSVTSECVNLHSYTNVMRDQIGCVEVTVTAVEVDDFASNFTFSSELTYSLLQNITASTTFNMPVSCTGGLTCSDWATVQSLTAGAAFTCEGTSTCLCNQTASDSFTDTGTYALSGTNITLESNVSLATIVVPYCIQGGSTMHVMTLDPTVPRNSAGVAVGKDIVAQKQ